MDPFALRMSKFTKEDYRTIEENARQKGATNDQLSTIRRAEEASARDRLRQQKAASTVTSSVNQSLRDQSIMSRVPSLALSPDTVGQPRQTTSALEGLSQSVTTQSIESEQTVRCPWIPTSGADTGANDGLIVTLSMDTTFSNSYNLPP
ncbi:hypothetical protein BDR22DRAFT_888568 [Usnea florida]